MELAQVRLLVSDFSACYHFYADVLGLKPQSGAVDGPYEKFSPAIGSAGIAFQDRSMMAQLLDELEESETDRMRVAHLKDPEGNLVELQEWLLLRG